MSVDFEKVNNRIQLLEQENKELHEQLNSLSSNKHKPKHNNGSSMWNEELEEEIVDTVSRKALLKSQDEVWKGVNFLRNCLQFMGVTSLAVVISVVGFIIFESNKIDKIVTKTAEEKTAEIVADKADEIKDKQEQVLKQLEDISRQDDIAQEQTAKDTGGQNYFVIVGEASNEKSLRGIYEEAKRRSDGEFGFGNNEDLVAKICSSNSESFLVLTSKKDNTNNAVTANTATWISKQALVDNFEQSKINIVGEKENTDMFNSISEASECQALD